MPENPFAIIDSPDGRILQGITSDEGLKPSSPRTYLAVCDGAGKHGNALTVMAIHGLWQPAIGSVVELGNPNREARVCSLRYAVAPDGILATVVYLDDPATTEPD